MTATTLQCPSCGGPLDPDRRACPHCGVTVATRRCGLCLGMNLSSGRNCIHCGRRLPLESEGHREEKLVCCGCSGPMTPRRLEETQFDECDCCGGLWLGPSTMASVRSEAEARARLRAFDVMPSAAPATKPAAAAGGYRKCPVCSRHMNRNNYARGAGVIVDVCKEHGSFFDCGELTRIFHFIEEGGLEKMRQREKEEQRSAVRDARREAIEIGAADPRWDFGVQKSSSGIDLLGLLARILGGRIE